MFPVAFSCHNPCCAHGSNHPWRPKGRQWGPEGKSKRRGGKSAKKKTCREGEERDNYPWVSEAKMASNKYTSYDAT